MDKDVVLKKQTLGMEISNLLYGSREGLKKSFPLESPVQC